MKLKTTRLALLMVMVPSTAAAEPDSEPGKFGRMTASVA